MRLFASILLLLTSIGYTEQSRYALVAGQNNGGPSVMGLRYAESDAQQYAKLLAAYASFPTDKITMVLHPDSAELLHAIDSISKMIASSNDPTNTLFMMYYSGHADAEGLLLGSTHVDFITFKKKLDAIPAGMRIAVFDACQSGVVVAFKGGKRAEPFYLNNQQKSQGEVWIASSSANEQAQESESLKSSLFSFHLFNGLRGSADISADNKVTLNEAYQYAYRKTIETSALTSGIIQHPVYRFNISGEGDIILADLTQKKGGVIIDRACRGSFLILSRDYTDVYADFRKDEQKELFIALPSGDYTIINAHNGTDINLYQFSLAGSKTIHCTQRLFHKSLLHESRIKGVVTDTTTVISQSKISNSLFIMGLVTCAGLFLSGIAAMTLLLK
jgi:hypothetical protein